MKMENRGKNVRCERKLKIKYFRSPEVEWEKYASKTELLKKENNTVQLYRRNNFTDA